jgi:hypothetical protein
MLLTCGIHNNDKLIDEQLNLKRKIIQATLHEDLQTNLPKTMLKSLQTYHPTNLSDSILYFPFYDEQ